MAGLPQTSPVPLYAVDPAMIHPAWFYLILPDRALPDTVLSAPVRFCLTVPGLVVSCPTLTDPS